jgi:hypothetical protein
LTYILFVDSCQVLGGFCSGSTAPSSISKEKYNKIITSKEKHPSQHISILNPHSLEVNKSLGINNANPL